MLEKDEDAERGRGDPAELRACPPGMDPMAFVVGVKSNNGDRSGATPYCKAISRPLSNGILCSV